MVFCELVDIICCLFPLYCPYITRNTVDFSLGKHCGLNLLTFAERLGFLVLIFADADVDGNENDDTEDEDEEDDDDIAEGRNDGRFDCDENTDDSFCGICVVVKIEVFWIDIS